MATKKSTPATEAEEIETVDYFDKSLLPTVKNVKFRGLVVRYTVTLDGEKFKRADVFEDMPDDWQNKMEKFRE